MNVQDIHTAKLKLDLENPRFGLSEASTEEDALRILRERADIKELIDSICEKGFERFEPLIGLVDQADARVVILEGNRRLAAAKLITDPELASSIGLKPTWAISNEKLATVDSLPVYVVKTREEADSYIAFKHINGPSTWSALAKAKFATRLFDDLNGKGADEQEILSRLSRQIGDSKQLMLRMLVAFKVFEQAQSLEMLDDEYLSRNSLDFSHLYTMLQNPDTRKYIGLTGSPLHPRLIVTNPVPESHRHQLGHLMSWLFGTAQDEPLIKRQGTDRPKLTKILASAIATETLQDTRDFERAAEEAGFGADKWLATVTNLEATAKRVATGVSDLPEDMDRSQVERASTRLNLSGNHIRTSIAALKELFK